MRYEPSLDGLRALAVSVVVLYHFHTPAIRGGWIGVDVFFVLSGYLITSILAAEYRRTGTLDLKRFYWFRILRLAPALFVVLAFVAVLAVRSTEHRAEHLYSIAASALYFMNWNAAFEWGSASLLGHTWSLSVEEQFYFLWPLIFMGAGKSRSFAKWTAVAVVGIAAWRIYLNQQGAPWLRTYYAGDTHSESLFAGCFLAFVMHSDFVKRASRYWIIPVLALTAMAFTMSVKESSAQTWGISLASIMSAWLIASLTHDEKLKKFFSHPLMVYTGRISYGWYLWHVPIFLLLKYKVDPAQPLTLLIYPAMLIGSYMAAVLSYRYVEAPFIALKKRYPKANRGLVSQA